MGVSIEVWTQTPEKLPYTGGGQGGGRGALRSQISFRRVLQDSVAARLIELKRKTLVGDFEALQAQGPLLLPAPFREGADRGGAAGGGGGAQQVD